MKKFATKDEINQAADGRWPSVLQAAGVPVELLNMRKHQPCPECGGTDRYRFTDHGGKGTWICNQCHPEGGSPIDLLMAVFGYSFNEAKDVLAGVLGLQHGDTERREAKPLPAPVQKQDEERGKWLPVVPVPDFALPSMTFAHGWRKDSDLVFKSVFKDGEGRTLGGVARFKKSDGGKIDMPYTFCRHAETGVQKWCWRGWDTPRPIYGLDALAADPARAVLVVEGEKCKNAADAAELPFAVVTWHGGCNNWDKTDWSPIAGRKVVLWPDCDSERERLTKTEREAGVVPESKPYKPRFEQGGWKAMQGIADRLFAQGCKVFIVNVPEPGVWPHGYDIADALSDGGRIVDPFAVLSWQRADEWLIEYRPSESQEPVMEAFPAPISESVPSESSNDTGGGEGTQPIGGLGGGDTAEKNFAELFNGFALIEGKVRALEIKTAVEWTKFGLIAKFGKAAVEKWLECERKKTWTQSEVARAKRDKELFEAESDKEVIDMMRRYVYLDGSSSIWDGDLRKILDQKSVKMRLGDMYKVWENSPSRRIVRYDHLVFEPGKELSSDYINLFNGMPYEGKAELACPIEQMPRDLYAVAELYPDVYPILKLIGHLCNGDMQAVEYTLNWLAYPLQHIGTKMATALVFHGDTHGAGKTLLFEEIIKPIYGEYAATLGQSDLESQYTGNRSGKLFVLFEEIFNNKQKYDNSGAMKHMITGKTMRVERKFIDSYEEANHINCVFLSNEAHPFKIEERDRRYFVVWPENKTPADLKEEIIECLGNGGLVKFYAFLLSLPLLTSYTRDFSDADLPFGKAVKLDKPVRFDAYTEPPMTAAKQNVIALGRFGWQTFYHEWKTGEIGGLPYGCCITDDLYKAYVVWCRNGGEQAISRYKFIHNVATRMYKARRWWRWPESSKPEEKKQAWILKPKDMVTPDGVAEMDFIGRQVGRFRTALNAYFGVAND